VRSDEPAMLGCVSRVGIDDRASRRITDRLPQLHRALAASAVLPVFSEETFRR
jgi:hypothetical protein